MSAATLNGRRVTSARVSIPAWGCWYADVSIDGEFALTGAVELVVADLTLKGTVLSGGASKGRSDFRIVAGGGGWGKSIAKKSYANDAGVKLSTVLQDAASAVGEKVVVSADTRVGPSFVRPEGPASLVLEQEAPAAWYVDEGGVTRLGARGARAIPAGVTHGPVDLARGTVTLASETIADILPGLVVDGLTVVDVLHEITPTGGLRSTVWGAHGGTSRRAAALRAIAEQMDPERKFRGSFEYRVVTREGERLNLQPVRVSTGMPDLRRVPVRPGVSGCRADVALGSRVIVSFIDADPARPYVASFEDADGDGFLPGHVDVGGETEHLMTTEATALLIYNVLVALMAAAGGGPLIAAALQPLLGTAVLAALSAQAAPAPPTEAAQIALNATLIAGFATGVVPSPGLGPLSAAIAAISTKTEDASGLFPSIGSKRARTA